MNLMFWKKKPAGDAAANDAAPGLLERIKALLPGRLKSPPPFKAEVVEDAETLPVQAVPAGEGKPLSLEYASGSRGKLAGLVGTLISMARARMLIVGVVLLLLLLLAFGYAVWSIFRSSPDQKADVTELINAKRAPPLPIVMQASAPVASMPVESAVLPASAPADMQAESAVPVAETHAVKAEAPAVKTEMPEVKPVAPVIAVLPASAVVPAAPVPHAPQAETMGRKNADLQKKFDALKKEQQPSSTSVKLYPGDRRGTPAGGIATVGNSDPKAAAMTLKEAIEAMNAGENYQKKPAK